MTHKPINKLLIANRGEIACRVIRTARRLGITTVAVYSDADADALHTQFADQAIHIGPAEASASYLNIERIIQAARSTGADAIHPGYGFLSENATFAQACQEAEITFVGPPVMAIELMGSKRESKQAMLKAGVPCIPGYQDPNQDDDTLVAQAHKIGFPLMIKASAGGGGRGMRIVHSADDLAEQIRSARSEAKNAFASDVLILEKAITHAHHVEIQVFGDQHGNYLYLWERDCSVQRRHQKVVEEAPSPLVDDELRRRMGETAVTAAHACDYVGAGTVEFLLTAEGDFYFLEMNTRLQVEHPVTEMITGLDLVAWQLLVAEGESLPLTQDQIPLTGHAIEVRLYAEDPDRDFMPQTGPIHLWQPPEGEGIRVDHGIATGGQISPYYDPMVAKIICHGPNRASAIRQLHYALSHTHLFGVHNNLRFLQRVLAHPEFQAGQADTGFIQRHQEQLLDTQASISEEMIALACALISYHANPTAQPPGLRGWQNSPGIGRRLKLAHGETNLVCEVHYAGGPWLIHHDDNRHQIELLSVDGHRCRYRWQGVQRQAAFTCTHEGIWLHTAEQMVRLENQTHSINALFEAAASGQLLSPTDGAVVAVLAEPGASVSKGQTLVVVEAMKMEHPIKADLDGVVKDLSATVGQQVKHRQQLVQLKPD